MLDKPVIRLLQGYCDLPFGTTRENAVLSFGEPEETQNLTEEILNNSSLVYHYWSKGFSLFFDTNMNQAFCSVETDNKDTLLYDEMIFSLNEKEVIALMKKHNFELSDSEVHKWGEKRLSFDDAGLDCYFEHNKMVSLNFGVMETNSNFYYFPN